MNNKGFIKEVLVMTLADAITAIAVYFFLVPSHTSISSISGLGIVLTHFIPLPLSVITMAFNVILLIIGFILCGKEFGAKTVFHLSHREPGTGCYLLRPRRQRRACDAL